MISSFWYSWCINGRNLRRSVHNRPPLTAFERECDNAVTRYVSDAKRVPFGEETVIAYLYAKEAELTAIRTILASRRAGLDGAAIRERLRETYV